jgi:hypothetical protein
MAMTANRADIEGWFDRGVNNGATHMIVVCDTYDHDDYPAYVAKGTDFWAVYDSYNGKNMQRIMEVYDLSHDKQAQMNEHRAHRVPNRTLGREMTTRHLDIVAGIEHFISKSSGIDTDPATLTPCPFCGHAAGYYESDHQGDKFPICVVCTNTSCGVKTPQHYQSRELAAAAWNRRAPARSTP